jgi:hypothetical protein
MKVTHSNSESTLTLREEYWLTMLENKVLRKISGSETEETSEV